MACSLGVGFETLVSHCSFSLNLLVESAYWNLDKIGLPGIRRAMLASHAADRLLVVDAHHTLPIADTEVGTAILLPAGTVAENPTLADGIDTPRGRLFTAAQPGITRVFTPDRKWAAVFRKGAAGPGATSTEGDNV